MRAGSRTVCAAAGCEFAQDLPLEEEAVISGPFQRDFLALATSVCCSSATRKENRSSEKGWIQFQFHATIEYVWTMQARGALLVLPGKRWLQSPKKDLMYQDALGAGDSLRPFLHPNSIDRKSGWTFQSKSTSLPSKKCSAWIPVDNSFLLSALN